MSPLALQPHVTPDSFLHTTSPPRTPANPPLTPVLVYFISGNPGLISYYHPFLTLLSDKLQALSSKQEKPHAFHIHGHSLAGFEVSPPDAPTPDHYHDVEEQIRFIQARLDNFVQGMQTPPATSQPRVILMGHSVGTYIAMEVIRRHRERSPSAPIDFDIIGGVMLFPTVMDIAKSPAGKHLTNLLYFIPHLALVVSFLARILTTLLPRFALRALVKGFMGSPPTQAVDTTCAFLKSRRGVRQALHMAADEMRTITADKWADDVWGISSSAEENLTRMVFYFGRNDHWVAEQTREEIIEAKGKGGGEGEGGPKMVVCEDGLPHAFCLRECLSPSTPLNLPFEVNVG